MYDTEALESLILVLGGFLIVVAVILLIWAIFYIIGMWKLYVKMGQPGWKAIIPFYSSWTLVEMAGLNWYWFLLIIANVVLAYLDMSGLGSILSFIANLNICYNLQKKFNKSQGWFIASIFFNAITLPLLGYSSNDQVDSSVIVSQNGIFDAKKASNGPVNSGQQVTPQPVVTPETKNTDNQDNNGIN